MTGPAVLLAADDPALAPSTDLGHVVDALHGGVFAGDQAVVRDEMLAFAAAHDDALVRTCLAGHFTGSALVVDAAGTRVLLLFHAKLQRWLQPGGHADGDANLAGVALREAAEETGMAGLRLDPAVLDLDIHEIPAGKDPAHLHLDLRYLVVAPPGAEPEGNHESEQLRWFARDELAPLGLDDGTLRLIDAGLARASGRGGS